jgi:hypothetical protein
MYRKEVFEMLVGLVFHLEETDAVSSDELRFPIADASEDVQREFARALKTILAGYLASDKETQEMIYVTGLSYGLIDKMLVEKVIAERHAAKDYQ